MLMPRLKSPDRHDRSSVGSNSVGADYGRASEAGLRPGTNNARHNHGDIVGSRRSTGGMCPGAGSSISSGSSIGGRQDNPAHQPMSPVGGGRKKALHESKPGRLLTVSQQKLHSSSTPDPGPDHANATEAAAYSTSSSSCVGHGYGITQSLARPGSRAAVKMLPSSGALPPQVTTPRRSSAGGYMAPTTPRAASPIVRHALKPGMATGSTTSHALLPPSPRR